MIGILWYIYILWLHDDMLCVGIQHIINTHMEHHNIPNLPWFIQYIYMGVYVYIYNIDRIIWAYGLIINMDLS